MGEPKTFRMTAPRRIGDRIMQVPVRFGLIPHTYLITTRGRRTGKDRTHPVTLVERDGARWLVAPYGPVGWVHNARAAGRVRLRRRGEDREWSVREVGPQEAAPVLKDYLKISGPPRAYFHAGPDSPVAEFVAEAPGHPVFELVAAAPK
ncbi:nitroreductase family deazaflavin-dependent oxidoreductase [Aldersonia sp. NBC_00410]|uniref:nitroreductase family deazaflavin-dependent oxidoreductase n=1 Tax=Aldersonia sp. NBC_00410 TaxID=2975954 RepID=UPI00225576F1|nr:nitroreductase family deazaflavin-dependent oxidoreductase [Aldersonia sp. NBC_00410]MCX5042772.1 nitroreductase family deazaflavin-dependent oxidoreductase [Aldersonia sp. NBC_00410]